jgi:hypothetical protein
MIAVTHWLGAALNTTALSAGQACCFRNVARARRAGKIK